jgi:hypothetical protein
MTDTTPQVSQSDFEQALQADEAGFGVYNASDQLAGTGAGPDTIGGDSPVDTIVNVGKTVIDLLHNTATINASEYANAVPAGVDPMTLTGWAAEPNSISRHYKASSEWWRVWQADYDFLVGVSYYYGASHNGVGRYLDYVAPWIQVNYLPPDFSVDVRVIVPNHAMNRGDATSGPIAALPIQLNVTLNGFFSHLVSWNQHYNAEVVGTGAGYWH